MATVAVLHVPAEDLYLAPTLDRLPDLTCEIERAVAQDSLSHWFEGPTRSQLETALEADRTVEEFEHAMSESEKHLYTLEPRANVADLHTLVVDHGGTLLKASSAGHTWTVQLRFENHEAVRDLYEELLDQGLSVEISKLQCLADHTHESLELTAEQYEALETAIKLGYFAIPREATLEEVAAELDISHQALSERLRRAYRTLVTATLGASVDADADD